jgi:lipopolysaccharide/colanic/teichoic acid biosynthesis glycosyltransferase
MGAIGRPHVAHAVPAFKRPFDVLGALAAIVLLGPIFVVTALAVRLTSPGPILFRQTRLGLDGAPFQFLKFRSMYVDAEARKAELAAANERNGKCFKIKDDPRVTPVGRFIRRYSIDEFPQLFNVLRGEMSLVGPRPALPDEVAEFTDHEKGRMAALPGITGLWQVSGRAELSFAEMIELDLRYTRECSLVLDIAILLRTVVAVLSGRGAY